MTRIFKDRKHIFPEIDRETQIPLFISPISFPQSKSLGGRREQVAGMATVGMNDFRGTLLACVAECSSVYAFVFILGKADCSPKPWVLDKE